MKENRRWSPGLFRLARFAGRIAATLLAIHSLTFVCFDLLPAPELKLAGWIAADKNTAEKYREHLGLEGSSIERFRDHLLNLLKGEFGRSLSGAEVSTILIDRLQTSAPHLLLGVLLVVFLPVPTSLLYFKRPESGILRFAFRIARATWIPAFFGAAIMSAFFSTTILPTGSNGTAVIRLILMSACGASLSAATLFMAAVGVVRDLRDRLFVTNYRAFGFNEAQIVDFLIPNILDALRPILGRILLGLIMGMLFTEIAFDIPGFGRLFAEAVKNGDFAIMAAWMTVTGTLVFGVSMFEEEKKFTCES